MKISTQISNKVFVLSALTLAMSGPLYADDPVPLTEGETITVTGTADAAPVACTGTSPVITCSSLRSAVVHANANANATKYDVINLPSGTITLSVDAGASDATAASGDLDINEAVNIFGADSLDRSATTINGGGAAFGERIFSINGVVVGISDVTLTNAHAVHDLGGAIFNDEKGNLTLSNCAITNSTATWDGDYTTDTMDVDKNPGADGTDGTAENPEGTIETQGSGGAVYSKDVMNIDNCVFRGNVANNQVVTEVNDPDHEGNIIVKVGNGGAINASQYTVINNSTFGSDVEIDAASNDAINGGALFMTGGNPLVVTNSTFSYNTSISGGGINIVSPSAPATITNTTISGNHVTDSGAGIETNSAMELLNVTIANNVKDSSTKGSGLNTGPGVGLTARNVLFDNNLANGLTVSANCGAKSGNFVITSQGGNVSSDGTCDLNLALGDQEDATINLLPLADNNGIDLPGTTFTHALPLVSAAVDTGVNTGCPNNDQRGSLRPFDASLLFTAYCDSGAYELYIERADLHIENMTAPSKVILGDNVTVAISVDNGDPAITAVATKLVTNIPAELVYVSATPSVGTCSEASGVVTCELGDLSPSAIASVSIVATANTLKKGVIVGTSVTSTTSDPNPSNNLASVTFDIVEVTDLSLTAASASPASLNIAGVSTVSVSVLNRGPSVATGVQLSGLMPSIVSFVQGVGCTEVGGVITCDVGALAADATADVVFEVKAESAGTAIVTATVTADQVDSDPSDNSGSVTIGITAASSDSGGGFCSYHPNGRFDPVLPALILMALAFLGYRRLGRESNR